ncbi:MAG: hypothetical protein LC108_08295 [Anaerolineales bacterium]|nr:hypothetical protein [Anaerolineales bacterium]
MTTKTEVTPATKAQLDALIELVKDAGMNEAAGLLQLGSDEITKEIKKREGCLCFELQGDNDNCPVHGKPFTDDEIKADYQERNDLYMMGMGA